MVKIVDGTDPAYEAEIRKQMGSGPMFQKERAADHALVRTETETETEAMQKNGYIVVEERYIDIHDATAAMPNRASQTEVIPWLVFEPAVFDLSIEIIGIHYDIAKDGKVHELATILEYFDLDTIIVEERSIATEPRGKMSKYLYGPKFDHSVNNNQALLHVYQGADGLAGRTGLTVLTKTKLYSVDVGKPLVENETGYTVLFDIASKL